MNDRPTFQVSQKYEVVEPDVGKAYLIQVHEWEFVKEKLDQVEFKVNIYDIFSSLSFGVSGSALIGYLTTQDQYKSEFTCLFLFIALLVFGILAHFLASVSRKQQTEKLSDILSVVRFVENRFKGKSTQVQSDSKQENEKPKTTMKRGEKSHVEVNSFHRDWKELLAFVCKRRPSIGSILNHAKLGEVTENSILILFTPGSFFEDQMQNDKNREMLQNLVAEFYNREVIVRIGSSSPSKVDEP